MCVCVCVLLIGPADWQQDKRVGEWHAAKSPGGTHTLGCWSEDQTSVNGTPALTTEGPSRRECSFAKTHIYCIILAEGPHGSWKRSAWKHSFLKTGLRVVKSKIAAPPFSCGQWIQILSKMMTPSPHPSTSCLRHLNPAMSHTTTTMAIYMLMFVSQKSFVQLTRLVVECELQQQFDPINLTIDSGFLALSFHLLVVFGFSVYSLFVKARKLNAHAPSLLLHFWLMSRATYRLGIWSFFSVSVWTQIFLKRWQGR